MTEFERVLLVRAREALEAGDIGLTDACLDELLEGRAPSRKYACDDCPEAFPWPGAA